MDTETLKAKLLKLLTIKDGTADGPQTFIAVVVITIVIGCLIAGM